MTADDERPNSGQQGGGQQGGGQQGGGSGGDSGGSQNDPYELDYGRREDNDARRQNR